MRVEPWDRRVARGLNEMVTGRGIKVVDAELGWYHTSRLTGLIRSDDDLKKPHFGEVFEVARATDGLSRHITEAVRERFNFLLVDLEGLPNGRDAARSQLTEGLVNLAELIRDDEEALAPGSEGGVRRTSEEKQLLQRKGLDVLGRLTAYLRLLDEGEEDG